jgi:RimJ/RimL family protein N-acetyltransferase
MSEILETPRLVLQRFRLDDVDEYFRLGSIAEVARYIDGKTFASRDEAEQTLRAAPLRDYQLYGYGRLACFEKESGRFIGWNGVKFLPEMNETDIGYRFFPDCWGKGYATESSLAVMKYARETLGLERIIGIVRPDNEASVKVLRKIGLSFEKRMRMEGLGEMDIFA